MGAGILTGEVPFACRSCSPAQQSKRGCREPAPAPVFTLEWEDAGETRREDLWRCPLATLPHEVWEVLQFYGFAVQGILPAAGGLLDQSATFLAAVRTLQAEVAEHDRRHSRGVRR